MNRVQVWTLATRPKTLILSACPVLVGVTIAISAGHFSPWLFLCTLLTAMGIQIGTNLANDYYDFLKGADTSQRKGSLRVTQAGLVTPEAMKRAIILCFTLTFLLGCVLIWKGGITFAFLLAISIALGVLYTGGPYPLAYLGIGEMFVFLFFGPIAVLGTYYLQAHELSKEAFIAGIAPGALSMAVLHANNMRDVEEDRKANKRTLPVRFGRGFGRFMYIFCLSIIVIPCLFFYDKHPFILLTLLTLLPAIPLMRAMMQTEDPKVLHLLFANTGKLPWLYTLLFSIGWML